MPQKRVLPCAVSAWRSGITSSTTSATLTGCAPRSPKMLLWSWSSSHPLPAEALEARVERTADRAAHILQIRGVRAELRADVQRLGDIKPGAGVDPIAPSSAFLVVGGPLITLT